MASPLSPSASETTKFSVQEEEMFQTLANHTTEGQPLTKDQVRSIRKLFDKADHMKTGTVDSRALEDKLLRLGDQTAHRVIRELVQEGVGRLTFPEFVRILQQRLTTDEVVRLQDTQIEYLDSMGIDSKVREEQTNFGALRGERSSLRKASLGNMSGLGSSAGGSTGEQPTPTHQQPAPRSRLSSSSSNISNSSNQGSRVVKTHVANDLSDYLAECGIEASESPSPTN